MTAATRDTAKPGGGSAARSAVARSSGAYRAATCLHLAATPTFALMALATLLDASPMATMCAGSMDGWSVGGMAPMYLLMAAFHLGPWLEMVAGQRGQGRRLPVDG